MALEDIREQLDCIDAQIVELFEQRMKLCEQVGYEKLHTGKKVYDEQREREKLSVLSQKATTDFNKQCIRELFEHIMSMSRTLQYQILNEEGEYHESP